MRRMFTAVAGMLLAVGASGCGQKTIAVIIDSPAAGLTEPPAARADGSPEERFAFPNDAGGKLLAAALAPAEGDSTPGTRTGPKPLPGPARLERPDLAMRLPPAELPV